MLQHGRVGYIFQMIKTSIVKSIIISLSILFFMVPVAHSDESERAKYQFEKKDKVAEQQRFLEKLTEDKKKVELAIENTKILIDKSRNMPYVPELYLRLAELYIEKSRFVFFIRKNKTGSKSKSLDSLETNTLKNHAIETYQKILNDFPDYPELDKIRFFMAHEYRELNQIPEMIKQYRKIIRKHPNSKYVPECLLLLGDHFVSEQDLDMALRHYNKVLNYPESSAIIIARYKLAWGHVNKGDYKKAITLFEKAVKASNENKDLDVDTYKRVDIKLESLVDMAFCYPEAYKKNTPTQAIAYFKNYSWSRQTFTLVLEKLAYRYLIKKKYQHAVELYRKLAILQHDVEKQIEYSKNIFECVREIGSFKNADQDMVFIVNALKRQKYSSHIKESEKKSNLKEFELYARDIITHLHKKAKKKNSQEFYSKASDSYKLYLDFFNESPVYSDMLINYSESLFSAKQYLNAGKQYEKLLTLKPIVPVDSKKEKTKKSKQSSTSKGQLKSSGKKRKEFMNSAIISFYNALKNKTELNYYQIAYARDGLKSNGHLFVKNYPNSPKVPDILFNISWILFDAGKYNDAIKAFTDFVEKYPTGKPAESAIHLAIEAYHLRDDYEGLVIFGRKMNANKKIDKKVKREIAKIVKASESKLVSLLTIDAMNDWELGSQEIESVVEKNKTTGLGEQALNALIISSKDKGKLDTIFSAGYKLIKYYPKSDYVPDVLAIMIDSAANASQLRVVTKYFEEFANRRPKHEKTIVFLKQAGQIRRALGQFKKSAINYEKYLKQTNNKTPGRIDIVFTIADNYEKSGNLKAAKNILQSWLGKMSDIDSIRARSLLATYYSQEKNFKKAVSFRKKAQKQYNRKLGKQSPEMNAIFSKMQFDAFHGAHKKYMALKLGKTIDNTVVATKAKMLENLENGYLSVIKNQSPIPLIAACYYASEINAEFARFLRESPLPELSETQKKEYKKILFTKSMDYMKKAEQYMETGVTSAHKWEICDSGTVGYYDEEYSNPGSFGGESSTAEIAEQFLKDEPLKKLHYELVQDPENVEKLIGLSDAYYERTDYYLSKLIAQKVADNEQTEESMRLRALENIAIANLYTGNDQLAKAAYEKILELNSDSIYAKINLAAIFQHYRHMDKAADILKSVPVTATAAIKSSGSRIHPVAKDMYYAFIKTK